MANMGNIPQELQKLVSMCPCRKCAKCKCWDWYNKKKQEGFSAEELDDIIMKEGNTENIIQKIVLQKPDMMLPLTKDSQCGVQSLIINHYQRNLTINNVINIDKGEFHGHTQLKNNI